MFCVNVVTHKDVVTKTIIDEEFDILNPLGIVEHIYIMVVLQGEKEELNGEKEMGWDTYEMEGERE